MKTSPRDLAIVACAAFCAWSLVGFQPYHIDEPQFLSIAGQILRQPLHPLSGVYNWLGRSMPWARANTNPLLWPYLLAGGLRLTGGGESATRLLFLPLDLAAALGLYFLLSRFLRRPLLPALALLACPAWALTVGRLTAEKPLAAFGLCGLFALVKGAQERRGGWVWAAAPLLGLACVSKYAGASLLVGAAAYLLSAGFSAIQTAVFCAAALAPLAGHLAIDAWSGLSGGSAVLAAAFPAGAAAGLAVGRLRGLLAFVGGCGVATAVLPALTSPRRDQAWAAALAGALFLVPWGAPAGGLDRLLGAGLGFGGALSLAEALRGGGAGGALWRGWALSLAALLAALYPSLAARLALFVVIPAAAALAERLESLPGVPISRLWAGAALAAAALSLALAFVDGRYAAAQRALAFELRREYPSRRLWFTGHWGLQYYLERAGGRAVDGAEGWDQVASGDVVVIPTNNLRAAPPRRPLPAVTRTLDVACALPLRLMGRASFYGEGESFLPFAPGAGPLDEFLVGVVR